MLRCWSTPTTPLKLPSHWEQRWKMMRIKHALPSFSLASNFPSISFYFNHRNLTIPTKSFDPCVCEAKGLVAFQQHLSTYRQTYLAFELVTNMSPLLCVLTFLLLTTFSIWNARKDHEFTSLWKWNDTAKIRQISINSPRDWAPSGSTPFWLLFQQEFESLLIWQVPKHHSTQVSSDKVLLWGATTLITAGHTTYRQSRGWFGGGNRLCIY